MQKTTTMLLACMVLALAGCGGDDEEPTGGGATGAPATGDVTVAMKDVLFKPEKVTVKVGSKVKWVNEDAVDHNATAEGVFESPNLGKGETYEYTAEEPGAIDYVCTIHPTQKGTITVVD